jgi:thioredoxin 1
MQHANDATFSHTVMSYPNVLVEFWADWCGACKGLEPALRQFEQRHGDKVLVVKVKSDEAPRTMQYYNVRGLPTLLAFHNGQLLDSSLGNPGGLAGLEGLMGLR